MLVILAALSEACTLRPMGEVASLLFSTGKYTTTCEEPSELTLQCHRRCGYERKVSPILCVNQDFGTVVEKPTWVCSTAYRLDEGYSLADTHVACEHKEGQVVVGSCRLHYAIRYKTDDDGWAFTILSWTLWTIFCVFILIIMVTADRKGGTTFVSFTRGGGGGGSSVSFASTS